MVIELFRVNLLSDGKVDVVINQAILGSHNMSIEEFKDKVNLDNLNKAIRDFCEPLK